MASDPFTESADVTRDSLLWELEQQDTRVLMALASSPRDNDSDWPLADASAGMKVDAGESSARLPAQQNCRHRLANGDSNEKRTTLQEQEISTHRMDDIGRVINTGSDRESPDLADTGERQTTQKKKRKNHRGGTKKKGKKNLEPVRQADAATEDRGKTGGEIASEGQGTRESACKCTQATFPKSSLVIGSAHKRIRYCWSVPLQ